MKAKTFLATASNRPDGMVLFSNGCPSRGSFKVAVEFPCSICGVGIRPRSVLLRRDRNPSESPKKKILSFLIGPPTVKPHWFCL